MAKVFIVGNKVKLNSKGLEWARWSTKHKSIFSVCRLLGINAYKPDSRLTPISKTLRTGRIVFCGLIDTDMLVRV